jgi:hypothetical protein
MEPDKQGLSLEVKININISSDCHGDSVVVRVTLHLCTSPDDTKHQSNDEENYQKSTERGMFYKSLTQYSSKLSRILKKQSDKLSEARGTQEGMTTKRSVYMEFRKSKKDLRQS